MPAADEQNVYVRVGQRIQQLRRERRMSQERLALSAGLNRAYVGYIERAERRATIATIARVAKALGVELSECFRFE